MFDSFFIIFIMYKWICHYQVSLTIQSHLLFKTQVLNELTLENHVTFSNTCIYYNYGNSGRPMFVKQNFEIFWLIIKNRTFYFHIVKVHVPQI